MIGPLDEVCCARLPRSALVGLAELRTAPAVTVHDAGEDGVWVRWPAGDEAVLRQVLPLAGVELFRTRDGLWFRVDERLPTPGPPVGEGRRLDRILHPAPFQAVAPPDELGAPARLRLVRDDWPRSATALRCPLAVLAAWADTSLTREIGALRGARAGGHALLVGDPLPWLADGERYWGRRILTPLGWRPEPALPESALVAVLGLEADSVALLHDEGFTLVGEAALQPLTRGAIRRATADLHGEGAWTRPR